MASNVNVTAIVEENENRCQSEWIEYNETMVIQNENTRNNYSIIHDSFIKLNQRKLELLEEISVLKDNNEELHKEKLNRDVKLREEKIILTTIIQNITHEKEMLFIRNNTLSEDYSKLELKYTDQARVCENFEIEVQEWKTVAIASIALHVVAFTLLIIIIAFVKKFFCCCRTIPKQNNYNIPISFMDEKPKRNVAEYDDSYF